ncbi:MAG: FUSC family protein [Actinomycetes bacterium]
MNGGDVVNPPAQAQGGPGGLKMTLLGAGIIALLAVPAIVLMFTPVEAGAGAAMPGMMAAALGVLVGGVRRGLVVTVWVIIAVGICPVGLVFPALGVLLVACMGASSGFAAYRGMDLPIYMVNIFVGLTMLNPPALTASQFTDGVKVGPSYILTLMGVTAVGAVWSFGWMSVLRKKLPRLPMNPLHRESAMVYGATLALLTGATAAVALTWFQYSLAGWVILTIYIVCRPSYKGASVVHGIRDRAEQRAVGTVVGVLIAAALAFLVPNPNYLVIIGIGFLVAAVSRLIAKVPYWQYVVLLTPAMVFMDSSGIHVDSVALARVACSFIGIALALGALEFNRRFTFPWISGAMVMEAATAPTET